ncbi:MAG: pyridoxamine 5'-phosphate oxidase family protein [Cytophagaceae bacterium]
MEYVVGRRDTIAMLTTIDASGCLRSVPMTTMQTECEGYIWFFTHMDTHKVEDINRSNCINVSYSDNRTETYVSLTGHAEIVRDMPKMESLWKASLKEYFPKGLEDPNLALLKVHIKEAEYWDNKQGKMVQIWEMEKDAVRAEWGISADL